MGRKLGGVTMIMTMSMMTDLVGLQLVLTKQKRIRIRDMLASCVKCVLNVGRQPHGLNQSPLLERLSAAPMMTRSITTGKRQPLGVDEVKRLMHDKLLMMIIIAIMSRPPDAAAAVVECEDEDQLSEAWLS